MIKVIAKNFAKEDKVNEVLKLCMELIHATRNEEGCKKYELYQANHSMQDRFMERYLNPSILLLEQ